MAPLSHRTAATPERLDRDRMPDGRRQDFLLADEISLHLPTVAPTPAR
jgi:hypothetical protein